MPRLVDLAETKNAAKFKNIFEEKIAAKIIDVLEAKKETVAKKFGPMFKNPYEDNVSPLQQDVRGLLTRKATLKARPEGGFTTKNEGARTDVEGLNPDELNKGPQHGGGFTNEVPLKKVWYEPEIKAGATKQSFKK